LKLSFSNNSWWVAFWFQSILDPLGLSKRYKFLQNFLANQFILNSKMLRLTL